LFDFVGLNDYLIARLDSISWDIVLDSKVNYHVPFDLIWNVPSLIFHQ